MSDTFNPENGVLHITLPLPPADNQLHRSGRFTRYATAEYRDWLEIAGERLRAVLGDWRPDAPVRDGKKVIAPGRWWLVTGVLRMGPRDKDAANHIKAALDLLSGAWSPRKDVKDEQGDVIHKAGVVYKPGALWDDDCRAMLGAWSVEFTHHPEPSVTILACPILGPEDWRQVEKERRTQERTQRRQRKAVAA